MNLLQCSTLIALAAVCTFGAFAQTATLSAGRTLRIEFRMPTTPWPLQPNTLVAYGGYVTILQPHTRLTGALYNGSTLLGVSQSTVSAGRTGAYSYYPLPATFKSPGSPWNFPRPGEPAEVDFTSILDRSITGRMDFTIDAGSIQFSLASVALAMSQSAGPNYGQSIYPSPIITSVTIFPELPTDPPPPPPVTPPPPVIGDDDDIEIGVSTLKQYCEAAKGSAVIFRTNVTVTNRSGSSAQIAAPCTIDLAPNASFGADSVSLTFTGPLSIQSQGKSGLKMSKALISAPVTTVEFRGAGSEINMSESTLRATAGSLAVVLGSDGKMEINKRHSSQPEALVGTDQVTVGAGAKLSAIFNSANVKGPNGIHLNLLGTEGTFKASDGTVFSALQGTIAILGSSAKTMFELDNAQMLFGQALNLHLAGNESGVKLSKATLGPSSGTAPGGISIIAGSDNASQGLVEGTEVTIRRVRSALIQASKAAGNGSLKWEKGSISASGSDVTLESGANTEVKDNTITSTTRIRILTPSGGSCDGASNSLSAPIVQVCPAN